MILAILQARMSSTRLPGKVLKTIVGKPMLSLQIERVRRSSLLDKIIVATSTDLSDDPIEHLCHNIGVGCYRGSLDDVLDRFYKAAEKHVPDAVVRLTGDCPLADPEVIDGVISFFQGHGFDYVTNGGKTPTFPDGLDVEIFTFAALRAAWEQAVLPSEREHVTPYIKNRPDVFKTGVFMGVTDRSGMRWTVDEPSDFAFVSRIYEELYHKNPQFKTDDVINLLQEQPEIAKINTGIQRNEGLKKSLKRDEEFTKMEDANSGQQSRKESLAFQERGKRVIPGLSQLLSKRPDMFSPGVWPGFYSKAKGAEVWDLDGNKYIDMSISGIGANVLGYADPDVNAAVKEAIDSGSSSSLLCPEDVILAELLCRLHPWAEKVRYTRSGGEAMTVAVRIARAYTGRDRIVFCGYHGWHDWYLAANLGAENALGGHHISGLSPSGVPQGLSGTALPFQYNHIEELREIIKLHGKEIGAIVMEPLRGQMPKDGFLEEVRTLADSIGAVLVVDEISAGFRLNSGGAHLKLGLHPDIAVFSKAIGNGFPIAAIIGKADVMDAAQSTFISSTNWTERTGPAAAIATITKHEKYNVAEHLLRMWGIIRNGWEELAGKNDLKVTIGGVLPMGHFTFGYPDSMSMKSLFVQMMLDRGFLASTSYYAMYAHTEQHCSDYLDAVGEVFQKISQYHREGRIQEFMAGKPATVGFRRLA
ncbi:aminotransferase class III-fold pyridoxal phosphate-dependent enzyme [Desulfolutivibrio sulfoxidireducens]|uniref:aminotransferase class III-fold pyridoxal phosphate-dependent enzyme n=1 Tax=Desulfolutivibrio sulfoxidireducens TaxID=2773299 RepID=UPI00159D4917|nr:aminotransferase class III-fold pyridoxal phosphate-dependent enzyme [Desulfolutivibrio sulfoxidireducens]